MQYDGPAQLHARAWKTARLHRAAARRPRPPPPTPHPPAVYAGTKAFVDCFSRSLDAEYSPLGVRVQNQAPMFVATKMSKIRWEGPRLAALPCWPRAAAPQQHRRASLPALYTAPLVAACPCAARACVMFDHHHLDHHRGARPKPAPALAGPTRSCRRARLDAPSPDAWAAAAVRQIGRENSFTPYWFHGVQQAFVRLAPEWLINRQVGASPARARRQQRWGGSVYACSVAPRCAWLVAQPPGWLFVRSWLLRCPVREAECSLCCPLGALTCSSSLQLPRPQVMGIHQGFRTRYYRRLAKQQAEAAAAAAGEAAEGAGVGDDAAAGGSARELRRRK